jgi:hypothetical protein
MLRRTGAALVGAALLVGCGGADDIGTGTTVDPCALVPPTEVEQAVGNTIVFKPFTPTVEQTRIDGVAALIDLLGDQDPLDDSPTPTTRSRVKVQGLCGYVFDPDGAPPDTVQSLVLGVYPVASDNQAWLDTTARKLADQVLIRSGAVPTVEPYEGVGQAARLVRSADGTGAIVLTVDGDTGVVAEGNAVEVAALRSIAGDALAAAAAATAVTTSAG